MDFSGFVSTTVYLRYLSLPQRKSEREKERIKQQLISILMDLVWFFNSPINDFYNFFHIFFPSDICKYCKVIMVFSIVFVLYSNIHYHGWYFVKFVEFFFSVFSEHVVIIIINRDSNFKSRKKCEFATINWNSTNSKYLFQIYQIN